MVLVRRIHRRGRERRAAYILELRDISIGHFDGARVGDIPF